MRLCSFRLLFVLGSMLLMLIACTPQSDDIPPILTIFSKLEGENFLVPDTIVIEGVLADEENLPTMRIHIDARDDQFFGPIKTVENSTLQESFRIGYPLTDSTMSTGIYVVTFSYTDGSNERSSFYEISVTGANRELNHTYAITETNGLAVLHSLDDNGIDEEIKILNDNYGNALLDSRHKVFYHLSQEDGNFQAINLENLTLDWTVVSGNSELNRFVDLFSIDDKVFITQKDGRIRGFEHTGQLYYNTTLVSHYATALGLSDKLLLSGEKHKTDNQGRLSQYFLSSGQLKTFLLLESGEVKFIDGYDDDHAFVVVQYANSMNLYSYNLIQNKLEMETVFEHSVFKKAVSTSNGAYYLLTESSLYLIQNGLSQWNYNLVSTSLGYNDMAVDEVTGNIWLVLQSQVEVVNSNGQTLSSYALNDVESILLRYNF